MGGSRFLAGMRDRGRGVFEIELAEARVPGSLTPFTMLAFTCWARGGKIHFNPKKSMLFGPVLAADSAHPDHTHRGWASSFMRTLRLWSSSRELAHEVQCGFIRRLLRGYAPACAIQGAVKMMELCMHTWPSRLPGHAQPSSRTASTRTHSSDESTHPNTYIVVPYHPCLVKIQKHINMFLKNDMWNLILSDAWDKRVTPSVRLAFSRASPPFRFALARL